MGFGRMLDKDRALHHKWDKTQQRIKTEIETSDNKAEQDKTTQLLTAAVVLQEGPHPFPQFSKSGWCHLAHFGPSFHLTFIYS